MTRYIVRRLLTMLLTMFFVSMLVLAIVEIDPGNETRNILGACAIRSKKNQYKTGFGSTGRSSLVFSPGWSDWTGRRCAS